MSDEFLDVDAHHPQLPIQPGRQPRAVLLYLVVGRVRERNPISPTSLDLSGWLLAESCPGEPVGWRREFNSLG